MASRVVYINLTHGTPRTGLWCDACSLPSVVEVDVYWLRSDGPSHLTTAASCRECPPSDTDEPSATDADDECTTLDDFARELAVDLGDDDDD